MTLLVDALAHAVPTFGQDAVGAIPTGIGVDDLVGGLHPGSLWFVRGPSESGRTTLATQVARHAALHHVPTRFFAARHSPRELLARLLSGVSPHVPRHYLERGPLEDEDRQRIRTATASFHDAPLELVAERPAGSSDWLELANRTARPVRLVVIDDLDMLDELPDPYRRLANPAQLNELAAAWNATVVVTQAGRSLGWCEPWRPAMAQDSSIRHVDVLIDLDRPDTRGCIERAGEIDLHVSRNRYGPTGCVTQLLQGQYSRVTPFTQR